jgi:predicted AAA+ superfamily ATPase
VYIQRTLESDILNSLKHFAVVAITGPRQCGKSTLAKHIIADRAASVYLDLENPSHRARLSDPLIYFNAHRNDLICLDEIQRAPELFSIIRSLADEWGSKGSFLILGSASRDMLRQSSESLAGRIAYHRLTPFLVKEVNSFTVLPDLLTRGAFPASLLAIDSKVSMQWRQNFIQTFLERDLLQWTGASPESIRRLWRMLAHVNGQTANYSRLASSLGISDKTVRTYLDLLASTYMVMVIEPHHSNLGKRLIKAPKVYVADPGITAALLNLESYDDLLGSPVFGSVWEQLVLQEIIGLCADAEITYYRTASGSEVDFVVKLRNKLFAIECKASSNPVLSGKTHNALADIAPEHTFVIAQVDEPYPLSEDIDVIGISDIARMFAPDTSA